MGSKVSGCGYTDYYYTFFIKMMAKFKAAARDNWIAGDPSCFHPRPKYWRPICILKLRNYLGGVAGASCGEGPPFCVLGEYAQILSM